ncbi:MAG: HEAT repeat domain-containing protein [Syntrophobacteria bacterium]
MHRLWDYKDYVKYLTHSDYLVRRWAFKAIQEQFPRRYTPQVARLLQDPDKYLACAAPRYLARHRAIDQAPGIVEAFCNGEGNVPSSCAIALGEMRHDPAVDTILERLAHCESTETLLGILSYLGKIRREDCRRALRQVFHSYTGQYIGEIAAGHLLEHRNPEDIGLVLQEYLKKPQPSLRKDPFLERLMKAAGAGSLYDDLTDRDLFEAPEQAMEEALKWHPLVHPRASMMEEIISAMQSGRYQDVATSLAFDARGIIGARFPGRQCREHLLEIFELDMLALAFLEELSKRSGQWRRAAEGAPIGRTLASAVLGCYFSICERGGYLHALAPQATLDEMLAALKASSPEFPETIQNRLLSLAPVEELKASLTPELNSWGDIWTVRLMGLIGSEAFAEDLIRVVQNTDALSLIHRCAIGALSGIDEPAHETILSAIRNRELVNSWDVLPLLEHLPYVESFEIARTLWGSGGVWMLTRLMPQQCRSHLPPSCQGHSQEPSSAYFGVREQPGDRKDDPSCEG